jgi:hypothetical protein
MNSCENDRFPEIGRPSMLVATVLGKPNRKFLGKVAAAIGISHKRRQPNQTEPLNPAIRARRRFIPWLIRSVDENQTADDSTRDPIRSADDSSRTL